MSKFLSWLGQNAMGLLGLGSGFATQAMNQHNQNAQNEFNASEAAKNRNFQAQQAQLARDYQTEFYETYQSPSAMVRQYQAAGMNPALMAGGYNPPSAVSTSSPSGSAASAASPNYQSMEGMINAIGSLAQLKANIDNTKADTDLKRASAYNQERQGLLANSQTSVNHQSIKESRAKISNLLASADTEKQKQALIAAQIVLSRFDMKLKHNQSINLAYDNFKRDMETEMMKKFKTIPSETELGNIWSVLYMASNWLEHWFNKK